MSNLKAQTTDAEATGKLMKAEPYVKITLSPNTPSPEHRHEENKLEASLDFSSIQGAQSDPLDASNAPKLQEHELLRQPWKKDVPICIDFGIQDYLCCGLEGDLDVSSDTDTSYLGATPPHRFSDGEIEPIEALPVLLDTELNIMDKQTKAIIPHTVPALSSSLNDPPALPYDREPNFCRRISPFTSLTSGTKLRPVHLEQRSVPRPFRRNVSLPATIFQTYLVEEPMAVAAAPGMSTRQLTEASVLCIGSVPARPDAPAMLRLSAIKSVSNATSQVNLMSKEDGGRDVSLDSFHTGHQKSLESNWNSGDSLNCESADDMENQPFTTDVEKRSIIIRHMRRLIRQDTTGNFAPPDFHI